MLNLILSCVLFLFLSSFSLPKIREDKVYQNKIIEAESKVKKQNYKAALQDYQLMLTEFPDRKADILVQKAICHVKDQELEKGLTLFVEALNSVQQNNKPLLGSLQYQDALRIYLTHESNEAKLGAQKIQEHYQKYYNENKSDTPLGFILSASHALTGDYPEFMRTFYHCYQQNTSHYMVSRILGMIHLKRMKLNPDPDQKERIRKKALASFTKALKQNPKDQVLFRLTFLLAIADEKPYILKENLKLILESDTMLARIDLYPYVRELLFYGQVDLADQLIDKAKEYYPVSRSLQAAEKYFNENQIKQGENKTL